MRAEQLRPVSKIHHFFQTDRTVPLSSPWYRQIVYTGASLSLSADGRTVPLPYDRRLCGHFPPAAASAASDIPAHRNSCIAAACCSLPVPALPPPEFGAFLHPSDAFSRPVTAAVDVPPFSILSSLRITFGSIFQLLRINYRPSAKQNSIAQIRKPFVVIKIVEQYIILFSQSKQSSFPAVHPALVCRSCVFFPYRNAFSYFHLFLF